MLSPFPGSGRYLVGSGVFDIKPRFVSQVRLQNDV